MHGAQEQVDMTVDQAGSHCAITEIDELVWRLRGCVSGSFFRFNFGSVVKSRFGANLCFEGNFRFDASFGFRVGVCRNTIVLIRLASYYFLYFIAFDLDVTCKWLAADAVENAAAFQYNIHISPPFRVWGFWLVVGDWLEFGCLELVVRVGG